MVNKSPIDGKVLHTFNASNGGGHLLGVEGQLDGLSLVWLRLTNEINRAGG
jgi:hypothetical protein